MIDTRDKEQQSAAIQDVKSIDDEDKDKDIRRKNTVEKNQKNANT